MLKGTRMRVYSKIMSICLLCMLFLYQHSAIVLAQTNRYHNNEALKKSLEQLADDYSQITELTSIVKTISGEELFFVTISTGEPELKPALLIVAGTNGTDLAGTEVVLNFIRTTAQNYGKVDSVTRMLESTTFYIFPRVNPEATETLFKKPVYTRVLNSRPMDLDQDGQIDEDGYDDLNKDGQITWMRIEEPGGEWMKDMDYPGLLKKADAIKGEKGVYRLIREGFDNDGDGKINEDEPGGVNFNKNFTHQYKFFETGSGFHQVSEQETRAVVDFIYNHPNIAAVFSFSPNDNLIKPWEPSKKPGNDKKEERGRKPVTTVDKDDAAYYKNISEEFKEITGLSELPLSESADGAFNPWAYYHFGRWSFSVPTWWPPDVSTKDKSSSAEQDSLNENSAKKTDEKKAEKPAKEEPKTIDQRHWEWLQATNQTDAFLPWKAIKHPDFPDKKVEIGGFTPFAYTNPPADSLSVISQKFIPFLYQLGNWLPNTEINNQKVEHLHDNVYRLSVVISNKGYLPTNPKIGIPNKWCPKVKLALELTQNQTLVSGKILEFIDMLTGSGGSREFSWVVVGKRGETVNLSAGSPMTGIVKTTFKLQ